LKILIPIGFGAFIIWAFYDAMCPEQRAEMFEAFSSANYIWIAISLIFGFASHASRAYRWRSLLEPLGAQPKFWISYHAVMTGYLLNIVFPRAGEASRAAIISKRTNISFNKVLGTIIAERALDLVMLGLVVGITLILQVDNIEVFQQHIKSFQSNDSACGSSPILSGLGIFMKWIIILGFIVGAALMILKPQFRQKFMDLINGIWSGITSILKSKKKLPFIGHTIFIWVMYLFFFGICFPSLDATADIGINGILAGFVAGTIGIVLVQGGIGVYPAFVGLILTSYIDANFNLGIHPQALALGWLIWTSQTVMVIVLGLISLIFVGGLKTEDNDPS